MSQTKYLKLTFWIFSIISVIHLLRLLFSWPVIMGDWEIPVWVSILGALIAGYLAYSAYKLSR